MNVKNYSNKLIFRFPFLFLCFIFFITNCKKDDDVFNETHASDGQASVNSIIELVNLSEVNSLKEIITEIDSKTFSRSIDKNGQKSKPLHLDKVILWKDNITNEKTYILPLKIPNQSFVELYNLVQRIDASGKTMSKYVIHYKSNIEKALDWINHDYDLEYFEGETVVYDTKVFFNDLSLIKDASKASDKNSLNRKISSRNSNGQFVCSTVYEWLVQCNGPNRSVPHRSGKRGNTNPSFCGDRSSNFSGSNRIKIISCYNIGIGSITAYPISVELSFNTDISRHYPFKGSHLLGGGRARGNSEEEKRADEVAELMNSIISNSSVIEPCTNFDTYAGLQSSEKSLAVVKNVQKYLSRTRNNKKEALKAKILLASHLLHDIPWADETGSHNRIEYIKSRTIYISNNRNRVPIKQYQTSGGGIISTGNFNTCASICDELCSDREHLTFYGDSPEDWLQDFGAIRSSVSRLMRLLNISDRATYQFVLNNIDLAIRVNKFISKNRNSVESRVFAKSAIEALIIGQKFDIEESFKSPFNVDLDLVKPNEDNPEPEKVKFMCIYNKLIKSPKFKKLFIDTFGESQNLHVKFKIVDNIPAIPPSTNEPNGITKTRLSVNPLTGGIVEYNGVIEINKSKMNVSAISLAKTILHESIHAYLTIKQYGCDQGTPLEFFDDVELSELLNVYFSTACPAQSDHEFMFNHLLPTMSEILADVKDDLVPLAHQQNAEENYTFIDESNSTGSEIPWDWNQFYKYLSMNGLQNSNAFINNISNSPSELSNFHSYTSLGVNGFSKVCND